MKLLKLSISNGLRWLEPRNCCLWLCFLTFKLDNCFLAYLGKTSFFVNHTSTTSKFKVLYIEHKRHLGLHSGLVVSTVASPQEGPNQFSTVPESPTQFSSLSGNMLWSTVSNAALRSSNSETETLPLSAFKQMPLNTLIRAVSVL